MGGPPNPGTPPDKRLKGNDKSKIQDKAKNLAEANKGYAKSIPVDGPRQLPPAKDIPGKNQLPPSFVKNIRKK